MESVFGYLVTSDSNPTRQIDNLDAWLYLTLAPIGFITSTLLFFSHLLNSKLRKHPGDLIMMVAFAELLLTFHWATSALHS